MRDIGSGLVKLDTDGHRVDLLLNRPDKRNAMNEQLMRDLTRGFEEADAREGTRAIVLLGEGDVFCAGMDLHMMRERVEADADIARDVFPELLAAIEETSVPTVAAVKRAAPAGAFELTLPFDFRVLGSDANYGVIEVQLGTFPHGGATQRLPRLVGVAKAKELVLGGEFIDPEEALDAGLVTEVVPDEDVDERARELADSLTEHAPLGMERAKQALNAALEMPLDEGLQLERALGRELDDTRDYREGFEARIEGRDPEFEGR